MDLAYDFWLTKLKIPFFGSITRLDRIITMDFTSHSENHSDRIIQLVKKNSIKVATEVRKRPIGIEIRNNCFEFR